MHRTPHGTPKAPAMRYGMSGHRQGKKHQPAVRSSQITRSCNSRPYLSAPSSIHHPASLFACRVIVIFLFFGNVGFSSKPLHDEMIHGSFRIGAVFQQDAGRSGQISRPSSIMSIAWIENCPRDGVDTSCFSMRFLTLRRGMMTRAIRRPRSLQSPKNPSIFHSLRRSAALAVCPSIR
jgi:hypothetical protein